MAENDADKKPDESNFLETIEDNGGDSGTTQTEVDKHNHEDLYASGDNSNTRGEKSPTATAADDNNSGIVETIATSDGDGALGAVEQEQQYLKEMAEDRVDVHTEKTQSIPEEDEYRAPEADPKKNGLNAEDPIHHILETIDPQSAFPDPPIFDPDSLQTADISNSPNARAQASVNNSSEVNSLDIPDKKTDSVNQLQNDSSLDGMSAGPTLHANPSRRPSKDSVDRSNLSINSIRNQQASRSTTILKPKSSLREPEYKHQKEEFLDSNMLISNTKLDGLLFRLFSLPGRLNGNDEKALPFVDDGKSDIISMDPVIWNLRPMTAVHRETLDSEMEFLEDTLMPKQVVRQLFMDGILTHMDYNQIMRTEGQGEKAIVRLLIGTLKRRGEKAFPLFMKALKDLQHSRIWERLDATERSLSEALADDQRKSERRSEMERLTTRSILKTRFKEDENSEDILREFLQSKFDDASPTTPITSSTKVVVEEERYGPDDQKVHGSSPSTERLQSRQLGQQLDDISAELKALHEGLNLLQSARSSTGGVPQKSPTPTTVLPQSMDSENPNPQTPKPGPIVDTEQSNMAKNSSTRNNVPQKSGTCVIL